MLIYQSATLPGGDKTAPSWGGVDYWLVRTDAAGRKLWDRSYGGKGNEYAAYAAETDDGGFIVVGDSFSAGISGNKGIDGSGIWLLKLNSGGLKEAEQIIPGRVASLFPRGVGYSIYAWPDNGEVSSLFKVDVAEQHRVVVSVRATSALPYNIDVSADLNIWSPLVTGSIGDLELKEPIGPASRFYRVSEP